MGKKGPKSVIDPVKMNEMFRSGMSGKEIGKVFGVSHQAVYQFKKGIQKAVIKNIAIENAGRVVSKSLDAVDQLQKINEVTNKLLDELTGEDQLISRMVDAVERSLDCGDGDDLRKRIRNVVKEVNEDKNTAIRACAEIRNQLRLQLDIFQTLYDMKAVEEFQQEVLDAIGEVEPYVRSKIVQKLGERRIIRTAIKFH
jgi:predicted DNA-binding protein YlxM (UPF0122 family)